MTRMTNSAAPQIVRKTAGDIRLLVLDIDGTILNETNRIRDSVTEAIRATQRRGVAVALATGRMRQSSLPVYELLASTLPLICYEGALILQPRDGFIHRHWPLGRRAAGLILGQKELIRAGDRVSVQFYIQDNIYVSKLNDASTRYFEGSPIEPIVMSDVRQLLNRAITKMVVLSDDDQVIGRLSSRLQSSRIRTQVKEYRALTFLEAFHPAVNKRLALSYLAETLMAIRPENVMAIGDDSSDIEMLNYAGIGVAMGNAPATVQALADWVTTTVEKDGVAMAIEKWILSAKSDARSDPSHDRRGG